MGFSCKKDQETKIKAKLPSSIEMKYYFKKKMVSIVLKTNFVKKIKVNSLQLYI